MSRKTVNIAEKYKLFSEQWSPKIIAQMNDYHFKIAKIQGEFVWHSHPETDEVFMIMKGELNLEFRDGTLKMKEGDLYVVPKGVEHRPVAEEECYILLVEPAGTVNTGDVDSSERTVEEVPWI